MYLFECDNKKVTLCLAAAKGIHTLWNYYNKAIRMASRGGHVAVIALLLDDPRMNPADYENGAIRSASYFGWVQVVEVLLDDPRVNPADCLWERSDQVGKSLWPTKRGRDATSRPKSESEWYCRYNEAIQLLKPVRMVA